MSDEVEDDRVFPEFDPEQHVVGTNTMNNGTTIEFVSNTAPLVKWDNYVPLRKYDLTIKKAINGYMVHIGCTGPILFLGLEELLDGIENYYSQEGKE